MSQDPEFPPPAAYPMGNAPYYPPPGAAQPPIVNGPVQGHPGFTVVPIQEVQRALEPMNTSTHHSEVLLETLTKEMAELKLDVKKIAGNDGDNARPTKPNPRGRKRVRKDEDEDKPETETLSNLQNTFRRVFYSGCGVEEMTQLQLALPQDEFEKRQEEDPNSPWRPDFMANPDTPSNTFWVNKMLDDYMKDTEALKLVQEGKIDKKYWTRELVFKHVVKPMWYSVRAGVKQATDPAVQDRVKRQAQQGLRHACQKRLLEHRIDSARPDKQNPFLYEINKEARPIPEELLIEEITSNVVSDEEYEPAGIRPDVTVESYCEARKAFSYKGIPPFYRRDMWNKIFAVLDQHTAPKKRAGNQLQPRYYASKTNRGQRMTTDTDKIAKIPVTKLYRCHIDKTWYNRLATHQRSAVKPSPKGWEVDEELVTVPAPMEE
ncbi:hypothetical protein FRC07_005497 [Ceratobasidium sp. 392]|nr:hypothetical protein FRC07_005497 [Ceratobasidium sp. 392]